MREQDKIIIWPAYFDATKTRTGGRRVPKHLAVSTPKIAEIKAATEKLGLECELVEDAHYSKTPWLQTGKLLVKKDKTKEKTIVKIAKQLIKNRSITITKKA